MILAPLVSLGLALAAQEADPAVIKVEDTVITASDLKARVREARARGAVFDAKKFADFVVAECVLATDARRRKLDVSPAVAAKLDRERFKVLSGAMTEHRLAAGLKPSEADLKAVFHQSGDTVRLKLIVVADRGEAQAILDRLRAGGDFALEASRSLDPGARERKGDSGTLTRGDMDPALAREAFSAKVGGLIGPVEMKVGWSVASVVERAIANDADFPSRRAELEKFLKNRTLAAARSHYLEGRRKQLKVSVDEKFLSGLGSRVDMTAAEAEHPVATIDGKPVPYRSVQFLIRSLAAGTQGSHTSGPATKKRVINEYLDDRILAADAVRDGVDRIPSVAQAVARAQGIALALADAEAVAGSEPPAKRQAAIDGLIAGLRKSLRVWVDDAAVARIVAEQP